jgi:hypothetical protein
MFEGDKHHTIKANAIDIFCICKYPQPIFIPERYNYIVIQIVFKIFFIVNYSDPPIRCVHVHVFYY